MGIRQLRPLTEVHRWKINPYVISEPIFWFSYVPGIMCVEADTFLISFSKIKDHAFLHFTVYIYTCIHLNCRYHFLLMNLKLKSMVSREGMLKFFKILKKFELLSCLLCCAKYQDRCFLLLKLHILVKYPFSQIISTYLSEKNIDDSMYDRVEVLSLLVHFFFKALEFYI